MKRIGANYLITNAGEPLKNAYLELSDEGEIIDIVSAGGDLKEVSGLAFYNGVLVPGFVNTHAHLELSHLRGKIERHKGLPHFISDIRQQRVMQDDWSIAKAIEKADLEMQNEGIVLVGDISNNTDSIFCKKESKIDYTTFVEVFGTDKYKAHEVFEKATEILNQFKANGLKASITPHAPYSVSEKLFEKITEACYQDSSIVSIHNQETPSEDEMFVSKSGELIDFFKSIGINYDTFYPTGHSSLKSTMIHLPKCSKINFVHNTFTQQDDLDKAKSYFPLSYWTFCPNANLYIENALPNISMFAESNLKICLGTDSLASNDRLSILQEIKTIQMAFPQIPFTELIKWSSYNGADLLGRLNTFGSFEKGKIPGVNLIENFDFEHWKLKAESRIKVLA